MPPQVRDGIIKALYTHLSNGTSNGIGSGAITNSIHNTLYGMAQLSMSLTPEVCGSPLCDAVMRCVENEIPSMEKWEFSRLLWDLGKLSDRGTMKLPTSTLEVISSHLSALVQPSLKTDSSEDEGYDKSIPPPPPPPPVQAEVRDSRNILWGLSTAGVAWEDLDHRAQDNLLLLVRNSVESLEEEEQKGASKAHSQSRKCSVHTLRTSIASTLGRMKTDLSAGNGSGDSINDKLKEWLLSERGILNYTCTPGAEESILRQLTPLLVGIANIIQSSTSTEGEAKFGKYNAHRQSSHKRLSNSQQENLTTFLEAACRDLENSLSVTHSMRANKRENGLGMRKRAMVGVPKGSLKQEQKLVCNLLWALGMLGYTWKPPYDNDSVNLSDESTKEYVLPRRLRELLQKHLTELYRREGAMEGAHEEGGSDSLYMSATTAATTSTDSAEVEVDHAAHQELAHLGYNGVSGSSILPLLSTSTLSFSPLQTLGSFRELLYPSSAKFNQKKDIYNWLGALACDTS